MRNSFLFLFLGTLMAFAVGAQSQDVSIEIKGANLTIEKFIEQVEKQTGYLFVYSKSEVDLKKSVPVNPGKKTVKECLNEAFQNSDVRYVFENDYIVLTGNASHSVAQQPVARGISGTVSDETGEPVAGANIVEKGAANGTTSDMDGKFTLNVRENAVLQISYIGYTPQEIRVGDRTSVSVVLIEDTKALGEVVVTALGIKRSEKALGYSVQKIGSEELTTVKGASVASSLNGKIAGVTVLNSNEFDASPTILLRGESPLVVIDGVPYENTGLGQVSADDIESINVLKGATASALYGTKGASGAIMVTTKRGSGEGLAVSVNSNTMFNLGYLVLPEVQSSYSSGSGGKYLQELSEYIWGDKLDIGRTSVQYDPCTYEWREMPLVSKGRNNFANFLETSFVLNNNVNVAYKGRDGSIRTSFTHVYNKGQFPGNKLNKFAYTVAGDMKIGRLSLDASIAYNGSYTPQSLGAGYSGLGYMYNMIVWTGTEFDVREFKDYWVKGKENELQNWLYKYDYNNPYFLAREVTQSKLENRANAQATVNYEITGWLRATGRVGSDTYSSKSENKTPLNVRNSQTGGFATYSYRGYGVTGDVLLVADKKLGDFSVGGILGAGMTFYQKDRLWASTNGGLTIPGFYSLKASKDLPGISNDTYRKQTNSLYGKAEVSWKSTLFAEVTGRNDWVSTLAKSERSYFYPSVSGSIILSELFDMPEPVSFLKARSSWTMTKKAAGEYDINKVYAITQNVWDGKTTAKYPETIRDVTLGPEKSTAFEAGGTAHFADNRIKLDVAWYTKLFYDIQRSAPVSISSGFRSSLINYGEERLKKGWEVTLSGDVIRSADVNWTSTVNWGRDRFYYHRIDDLYSTDRQWVKKGERWDWFEVYDWERDPSGNIIHSGGMPVLSKYPTKAGYERADWVWGFTNHLNYKSFTLDFSFDGRVGGKAYNRLEQAMWNSGTHVGSDNEWRYDQVVNGKTSYVGQGVKVVSGSVKYDSYGNIQEDTRKYAPNDEAVTYEAYTKTYHPWNGSMRSQNIKSLTFLKLREVAVGYRLPRRIAGKMNLGNVHISVVGQNLFIRTKEFKYSDPDAIYENLAETLNSPAMRYVGLNLKVDF